MILSVEPLCHGLEHARVNAALLRALQLACPGEAVVFLSEASHGEAVRSHLAGSGPDPVGIDVLPRRRDRNDTRAVARAGEFLFARYLVREAQRRGARLLVLTAVNTPILYFLSRILRKNPGAPPVLAVAHSLMQNLTCEPTSWLARHMGLRRTLAGLDPARLRVVVPGASVRASAIRRAPETAAALAALDLGYDFPPRTGPERRLAAPLRLGFLGVATRRKGIDTFYRLARAIPAELASFVVVGMLQDRPAPGPQPDRVEVPCPDRFLDQAERERLMAGLHYAVFPYQAAEYELVASAAFLDALAAGLPVLALRNAYFDHQFERLGDIGYLCADEDELAATVRRLALHPEPARYRAQQERLIEGRRFFTPETQALVLRSLLDYSSPLSPA